MPYYVKNVINQCYLSTPVRYMILLFEISRSPSPKQFILYRYCIVTLFILLTHHRKLTVSILRTRKINHSLTCNGRCNRSHCRETICDGLKVCTDKFVNNFILK